MPAIYKNGKYYGQDVKLKILTEMGNTPIGTIIAVMGTTAPNNYLVCDGTVYPIAEYEALANYFDAQFGSCDYFGGNGTTTFAVPDLRGEFLRGIAASEVPGVHTAEGLPDIQGSFDVSLHVNTNTSLVKTQQGAFSQSTTKTTMANTAYGGETQRESGTNFKASDSNAIYGASQHVTPTNTSVLYCIATKNVFVDARFNFSSAEMLIGSWIDGKPIYQKTFTDTVPSAVTDGTEVDKSINANASIDTVVSLKGVVNKDGVIRELLSSAITTSTIRNIRLLACNNSYETAGDRNTIHIRNSWVDQNGATIHITMQYTKTTD